MWLSRGSVFITQSLLKDPESMLKSEMGGLSTYGGGLLASDIARFCSCNDSRPMALRQYKAAILRHECWPGVADAVGRLLLERFPVKLREWESLCDGYRRCWVCGGAVCTDEHLATERHLQHASAPKIFLSGSAPEDVRRNVGQLCSSPASPPAAGSVPEQCPPPSGPAGCGAVPPRAPLQRAAAAVRAPLPTRTLREALG